MTGGVYWMEPEKHNIHFRGVKEELYRTYPRAIPAHLWYSTEPYIDEKVRKQRFERIVLALHEGDFNVGAWANRVIDDVKHHRDPNRAGPKEEHGTQARRRRRWRPDTATRQNERGRRRHGKTGRARRRAPSSSMPTRVLPPMCFEPAALCRKTRPIISAPTFTSSLSRVSCLASNLRLWSPFSARAPVPLAERQRATIDVRQSLKSPWPKPRPRVPDLIQAVGAYNVVYYDSRYYGVPQNLDPALSELILQDLWKTVPIRKRSNARTW